MGAFQESAVSTVWHNKKPRPQPEPAEQETVNAQEVQASEAPAVAQAEKVEEETFQEEVVPSHYKRRGRPRKH